MMDPRFIILFLLLLTGCCTKVSCDYATYESFIISTDKNLRGEIVQLDKTSFVPLDSTDLYLRENTGSYSMEVTSNYFRSVKKNLSDYFYIIKLKTTDSIMVDTLKSIRYEKVADRSPCNQCLIGQDYVEGFVYANYVLNTSKLGEVNGRVLRY